MEDLAKAQEHDEGGLGHVFVVVMNIEVKHESTIVQIKLYLNSSHPCMLLVDSRSTYNMLLANFARELEFPLV